MQKKHFTQILDAIYFDEIPIVSSFQFILKLKVNWFRKLLINLFCPLQIPVIRLVIAEISVVDIQTGRHAHSTAKRVVQCIF